MKNENTSAMLWVIFGYFVITSITTILNFIVHLIYFVLVELGLSFSTLTFLLPMLTVTLYAGTAFILVKRFGLREVKLSTFLSRIPRTIIIGIMLIPIIINPITNKLSGLYTERLVNSTNFNRMEYLDFFGSMNTGLFISKWIFLIALGILFLNQTQSNQNKT